MPDDTLRHAAGSSTTGARSGDSLGRAARLSPALAVLVASVGVLVLSGWALGIETLTTAFPGSAASMKPNTAVCMVLGGLSLWLASQKPSSGTAARRVSVACASALGLAAGLTLIEYLFHVSFGIDDVLFRHRLEAASQSGRMAPHTALSFVFLGVSLMLLTQQSARSFKASQWFALLAALISFTSLLGYVYQAPSLFGVAHHVLMGLHTAAALLMLGAGVLLVVPADPATSIFYRQTIGALAVRRLLPAIVLLSVVIGYFRLMGQQLGLYGLETGTALMVLSTTVLLGAFALWMSRSLDRADLSRRNAEVALRSEGRFRALLESAPDAMVIVSGRGEILLVNSQTEQFLGYSRDELVGRPIEVLVPERFRPRHPMVREDYVHAPRPRPMGAGLELYARRKDGTELPVEISLSPLESDQGPVVIVAIRDVTEKKAIEQMRRDLVAMLTHDLKTPLAAIKGFAGLLRDEPPANREDVADFLGSIDSAATRALTIATNFLDYTRIQSGVMEVHPEKASLNEIVRSAVAEQQGVANTTHVSLETTLAEGLPYLMLDKQLIERVVVNLLSNAIKFSPANASVHVSTLRDGRRVLLEVKDRGPGIPPEERGNLFRRFGTSAKSRKDSTGLGLFIVKTIVERHGGTVAVDCPAEGGTVLSVALPERADTSGILPVVSRTRTSER